MIDALSVELEERCYELLALQQPMASDLRAITTALWMNAEIERSGDLMTNICQATRRVYGSSFGPRIRGLNRPNERGSRSFVSAWLLTVMPKPTAGWRPPLMTSTTDSTSFILMPLQRSLKEIERRPSTYRWVCSWRWFVGFMSESATMQ